MELIILPSPAQLRGILEGSGEQPDEKGVI